VTCFCATYGRPALLEEAIESFLRQDYEGEKELVVMNDFAQQLLCLKHPEVTVLNVPERIVPLGRKFNLCSAMGTGTVLIPWEDDDVYLPWGIRLRVERMREGIFHTGQAWLERAPGVLVPTQNLFQCNLAVERRIFDQVGGYAETDMSAIDVDLYHRLGGRKITQEVRQEDAWYVYRWGTSGSYHGSGWGGQKDGISELAGQFVQRQVEMGRVPTGEIELKPQWRRDYLAAYRRAVGDDKLTGQQKPEKGSAL
jgi:glycosyltransferase involved in cell wall biosynthesis